MVDESLRTQVIAAFADVHRPAVITPHRCWECDELASDFAHDWFLELAGAYLVYVIACTALLITRHGSAALIVSLAPILITYLASAFFYTSERALMGR